VYGRGRPNSCQAARAGQAGRSQAGRRAGAGVGREREVRPPPGAASRQQGELGAWLILSYTFPGSASPDLGLRLRP
jgi:hypothetical protein